jgi:hypothetical protein
MEEAWAVIFRNLYTGFVLRDCAGKIVPGVLLLFSIAIMFRQPRDVLAGFKKDVPLFAVLLIAGFAWTVTLGTQSLAECFGIWRYFPQGMSGATHLPQNAWKNLFVPGPDQTFDADTLLVDEFQAHATEDEEQQYERFVVIKEACGNLFVAGLLSIPTWILRLALNWKWKVHAPAKLTGRLHSSRQVLVVIYVIFVFVGLHRMHAQHVYRQMKFAQDIAARHRAVSAPSK